MTVRNYSSIYDIKEFAINEFAPKYFDLDDISQMNIGLMGYTTDLIANTTEDLFNATTIYLKESFPNKAIIPESIFNYAALFQIDNLFAVPAHTSCLLFIAEDDIYLHGLKKEKQVEFSLDSSLKIDIEGKEFMLDYDIKIIAKQVRGEMVISAIYDFDHNNSLSSLRNPYIKIKKINFSNKSYIGLFVTVRQVKKFENLSLMISNDRINLPAINIKYEDQLAGFEVFYKNPGDNKFTQLKKRLYNTPEIQDEFCYYKFKSEKEIEISFSSRDFYFKPQFNSEVLVRYYTTNGSAGNFPIYSGEQIKVIPDSDKYDYNNSIILFAYSQSESVGGMDTLSVDELKKVVIEKFSTLGSYTTENDLSIFFSTVNKPDCYVSFIKKRDDIIERLFSAFVIMNDKLGDKIESNTAAMQLYPSDFDIEYEQTDKWILKPGSLFTYKGDSINTLVKIKDVNITDDITELDETGFLYTNPFLTTISKSGIVGYYNNCLDTSVAVEYSFVNTNSLVQFICNNVSIKRNALLGEDSYKITIKLIPTTPIPITDIIDPNTNEYLGLVKAMVNLEQSGNEVAYKEFTFVGVDQLTEALIFEADLKTDDYIGSANRMRFIDINDIKTGQPITKLLPMNGAIINICTFMKDNFDGKATNAYDYLEEFKGYELTNVFSTDTQKVDFIIPVSMMRSRMIFTPPGISEEKGMYSMTVKSCPFIRATSLKQEDYLFLFLSRIIFTYNNLISVRDKVTNNYSIDLKFYNTYGRSRHSYIGDKEDILLDKVNISIDLGIAPTVGAERTGLVDGIQRRVKEYVETINPDGSNSVYISNIIQIIENEFEDVKYIKFNKINSYPSDIQMIETTPVASYIFSSEQRRDYVPEFITLKPADVKITII